jgi:putative ABC transport system ATP-binding protein
MKADNTTISIAHRLSTIKRSDTIIVLSSNGTVAEQGTYKELSSKPDGAFTKLMEWQMSGSENPAGNGNGTTHHDMAIAAEGRGPPSELEHLYEDVPIEHEVEEEAEEAGEPEEEKELIEGPLGRVEKAEKVNKETK